MAEQEAFPATAHVDGHTLSDMLSVSASFLRASIDAAHGALLAVEAAQKGLLNGALKTFPECTAPPSEHREAHRPSRPPKIDTDPELRTFIIARIDRLTFHQVADAVAENFPPERRVGKTAIYDWWKRNRRPKRKVPNGPD
ncbi:MAG: hypothetical protein CFE34_14000 [Rhodobacteraceae bacterium PARR1]|nr:MAG: hypothetical protein CFE34_14000 [Rhodobacteraceae bacterium PARR1]